MKQTSNFVKQTATGVGLRQYVLVMFIFDAGYMGIA